MDTPSIRLRELHKTFGAAAARDPEQHDHLIRNGPIRAVAGVDLEIDRGEVVAILGPNGAGKTTTLDMILGFTHPDAGEIEVFGKNPRQAVHDGQVAAVLQTGGLLRDLTVAETVELVASTHPMPLPVDVALERAHITSIADRLVESCSGGEQQRLRYALALLGDPDLLILDEPTTGMDVETRRRFWATMHDEADNGRTIVFATHYLQEAEDFADRTVLMSSGKIVADGPTDEIRRRASGRRLRAKFDDRSLNELAAEVRTFGGVLDVTIDRRTLVIETTDSDDLARYVLGSLGGFDLEIEAASLEHAFVQLTSTHAGQESS